MKRQTTELNKALEPTRMSTAAQFIERIDRRCSSQPFGKEKYPMRQPLLQLIAIISALMFNGCASTERDRQTFMVSNSQTYFFEEVSRPDTELFNRTIQESIDEDKAALATILSWNRLTDGEGALSYSSMLLDLRKKVGYSRFEQAKQTLPREQQDSIDSSIDTAIGMRQSMKKSGLR